MIFKKAVKWQHKWAGTLITFWKFRDINVLGRYLTIILQGRAEYEMIYNQRGA